VHPADAQRNRAAVQIDSINVETASRITASACTAKPHSARSRRYRKAQDRQCERLGNRDNRADPHHFRATPPTAKLTNRAIGFNPSSRAFLSDMTRAIAAPSLVCDEFPAVTVPWAWNTGLS